MKFILGTKKYMTQIFTEEGRAIPGTVIEAGPLTVTQIKTQDSDGYNAVQVGYGSKKEGKVSKAVRGHLKGSAPAEGQTFQYLREFRIDAKSLEGLKVGDKIDLSTFADGDKVVISGISKGKGFQGVVKRHGFKGGPRTHGQKHSEREPGSIGATGPQRVFKGTRMAGRMGADRVSVKNLVLAQVDASNNQLFVAGAVPGRPGTLLEIRSK